MKNKEKVEISPKNVNTIILSSLVSALVITFFHNFITDYYIKNIIIPYIVLLFNYGFIVYQLKFKINSKAYILLIPIVLILISKMIIPVDDSNLILNVFGLPILISMFFFLLINEHYHISRYLFSWVFKLFPTGLFDNFQYLNQGDKSNLSLKRRNLINILRGCLIGIPIAYILLLLLSSADRYFSEFIGYLFNFFSNIFDFHFIKTNVVCLIICFVIFFVIFINILKYQNTKMKKVVYHKVSSEVAITILTIVNSVFVLFLLSEISKITINFLRIPVEYTYASYAREGFFQLLFVTMINFIIILYYLYYTKIIKDNKWVKRLTLLLIMFSIFLIFNSYYRMFLYIGRYGFTILRLQVILFLFMELLLFVFLIKKILFQTKKKDALVFTWIILTTYIINLYVCVKPVVSFLNYLR